MRILFGALIAVIGFQLVNRLLIKGIEIGTDSGAVPGSFQWWLGLVLCIAALVVLCMMAYAIDEKLFARRQPVLIEPSRNLQEGNRIKW